MKAHLSRMENQLNQSYDQIDRLKNENHTLKHETRRLSSTLKRDMEHLENQQNHQFITTIAYCVRVLRALLEEMQRFHRLWLPTYHSGLEKELLRDSSNERFRVASSVEIEKPPVSSKIDDLFETTSFGELSNAGGSKIQYYDTMNQRQRVDETTREVMDLYELLERVDRSIFMMKLLGDAKIESVTLVHKELKHQNTELQSNINSLNRNNDKMTQLQAKNLEEFQQKKNALRNQMEQLQRLYEKQKVDLQNKLKQVRIQLESQHKDNTKLETKVSDLTKKCHNLDQDKTFVEEKLIEQENARVKLAEQLDRERQLHQIVQQELSNLKLAQKFLRTNQGSTSNGSANSESADRENPLANIPKEKLDLMQTINHLMEENQRLKDENLHLNVRVKKYEKQQKLAAVSAARQNGGASRAPATTQDEIQEVHLIANDKLSDSQLTHKILARKLQQERNQRLEERTLQATNGAKA